MRGDGSIEADIGHYRILEKLGEGGVGEVFRARDPRLERTVALKRLRPELAARSDMAERFAAEARTLARLVHPNVAALYQLEEDAAGPFMVMEFVEGETLAALQQRRGALSPPEALPLLAQALEGLGHAHDRGVVHRDIKGSNLILRPDGVLKIVDFGIARVRGSERLTRAGQLVGTPEYMSPEQIRGEEADARSDLYSVGALFYALLSGELPFRGANEFELLRAQLESVPAPLAERVPGLPEDLGRAVDRALEKDPAGRFPDAEAFLRSLAPALAEAGAPRLAGLPAASAPGRPVPAPEPARIGGAEGESTLDDAPTRAEPLPEATGDAEASARPTRVLPAEDEGAAARALARRRARESLRGLAATAVLAAALLGVDLLRTEPAATEPGASSRPGEATDDARPEVPALVAAPGAAASPGGAPPPAGPEPDRAEAPEAAAAPSPTGGAASRRAASQPVVRSAEEKEAARRAAPARPRPSKPQPPARPAPGPAPAEGEEGARRWLIRRQ